MWKLLFPLLFLVFPLAAEYQVAAVTPNFVLHTADGTFSGGQEFLDGLNRRIDQLQASATVYLTKKAEIYVVPNRKAYRELAQGKSTIVEFSDAFYSSAERRIYIRSADQIWESYANVLIHEYTHWYLDEILSEAPLWFHEGMATLQANQLGIDRYLYYVRERFWGNKMDLFELAYQYPREKRDWEMYYLSSYYAVKYMQDKDNAAWRRFWNEVAYIYQSGEKARFTEVFGKAYSSDLYRFNLEFSRSSKTQAWIYLVIGFNSFIFALLPFVLVFAMLRHRRRMRNLPDIEEEEEEVEEDEPASSEEDEQL